MRTHPAFALAALLFCAACSTVAPDAAAPAPSAKEQYADILLDIVPPEIMFAQLAWPFAHVYTVPDKQQKAHANFMRNVDVSKLRRIIRDALLSHFSEADLKALSDFYSTPEGRACMAKTAAFAADVVPACAHEATQAFRKTATDAARNLLWP